MMFNTREGKGGFYGTGILFEIPRGDINGVGGDEVTVTSGLHAQAGRTNKQTDQRGLHPVEAQAKIRSQVMLLTPGR